MYWTKGSFVNGLKSRDTLTSELSTRHLETSHIDQEGVKKTLIPLSLSVPRDTFRVFSELTLCVHLVQDYTK